MNHILEFEICNLKVLLTARFRWVQASVHYLLLCNLRPYQIIALGHIQQLDMHKQRYFKFGETGNFSTKATQNQNKSVLASFPSKEISWKLSIYAYQPFLVTL